jgi:hypothetical protein
MPVREAPAQPAPPPTADVSPGQQPYPADKARGGEIILRTRMRRIVFIAGLVGLVVLLLLLRLLA